jgi:hypothetical protein
MKKMLILLAIALLSLPSATLAGSDYLDIGVDYYQVPGTCPGATNLANDPQNVPNPLVDPWPSPWLEWPPASSIQVPNGSCVLIGKENGDFDLLKRMRLVVTYTGGTLGLQEVVWGNRPSYRVTPGLPAPATLTRSNAGGVLTIEFYINQPDWEYVRLIATGAQVTITDVHFETECTLVPSLTQWGIFALVALMLAAGAIVIVRRRRAVVNA